MHSRNDACEQTPGTRRDFLKLSGGVASAATVGGLAGCLGSDDDGGGDDEDDSNSDGGNKQVDQLSYWGVGTTNPEKWADFTNQTDMEVKYTAAPWRPGQIVTKMVQGTASTDFDLAGNDTTLTQVLHEQDAIKKTNLADLPNWEHVYDEIKDSKPTTVDGEQYSLSSVQNGDSVAFLPQHVGDASSVNSYGILFDDEFKGKTALEAGWATAFHKVANYLKFNNMADIESVTNPTESDIDAVVNFLLEQKKAGQFRTFWSGWQSAVNLLAKEEVHAMDTWEPVVFALRDKDMEAEYLEPKEGYSLWGIGPWVTKKGAENRQASEKLINWMMDGWYNAQITTIRGYLSASELGIDHAKNDEDFDAEFIEKRHQEVRSRFRDDRSVFGNRYPETFSHLNEQWNRLTA
ncbi:putative spermidine/putrescine transport system substrate-binding protein [Haladaptatus litoreus]|uniref:Putative spermidine/putrescine transport system substrate-binding protein n=1 Tax=Haladaptatus litoreus TaxID=553468 RepID=A0A1N7CHT1_9EURY|nr:substrate-binding domain-containing protein [Haladaptatus litoreus]SIR63037.1 putative spermidine/putrescine transport system substrate-binding protein [Haladaptatus litoreus]